MRIPILFEDNHLIAVNKPAGLLSQGDYRREPSVISMVRDYIKQRDQKPGKVYCTLAHRLDRPVSGVLLMAKTSKAASRLAASFRNRLTTKSYLALVSLKTNDTGATSTTWREYCHLVWRQGDCTRVVTAADRAEGKEARLRLKTLYADDQVALHLVELITGRKHQIRAQLAHLGMPVVGDVHYGGPSTIQEDGIHLHGWQLTVPHPVKGAPLHLRVDPPVSFFAPFDNDGIDAVHQILRDDELRGPE
ncbi:MAG: RluA family pseudouridine synthase [Desulfofustis sp. PB-SRB1]|jgi:23S rRNA pseudouridine1911/1915/1917 synthase|nr:RluA family pseudouridine synthase [Desulfofustis sp. PB-SRB1]MBM1001525.1 RluA family pseudouridine synthase [Desulfofustis sp. PB-SRB1]HBH29073.1 RluA family pseudouridine synthase [Desulfofustis sp.]